MLAFRKNILSGALLLCCLLLGTSPKSASADSGARAAKGAASAVSLPLSCLLDFSGTLNTQGHGFLTIGSDGHFHWGDGTRARFWGINVSSTRLDIPPAQIEQTVETFAHAGLNLVRLEAIDNRNCLLGSVSAPDSLHFDPHYLDCLDRWMDALRRHGICYYLDLLDFRTFKAGDGVINAAQLDRGARPYALFDPYLIQLQKDYARALLTHRNPYSGLRAIDDPALALVEICNESGFFLYPEKLETLVEPYHSDLIRRWNQWLLARYGTRDRLAAAWGQVNGSPVLRANEDPNKNTTDLPLLTGTLATNLPANEADVRHAPSRLHDGVEFLAAVQRAYFREMRAYLRYIGLRVPVTAVVSNGIVPDVASVAQECDFTAENWYGEGQTEDARTPGLIYYGNRNPLRDDSSGGFAPFTAAMRWNNKPVVVREWATTWPNRWRSSSVPEALAYASLQDYDAVLLFGYQTNSALNGAQPDALNDFAVQSDPTTWGLYALAGRAFLSGAIRPAAHTLTLTYPNGRQFDWPNDISDLARAAWSIRINNVLNAAPGPRCITPTGTSKDLRCLCSLFDRLNRRGTLFDASSIAAGVWHSDTEQITRYTREGRLEVETPTLIMVAGEFTPNRVYSVGRLRFSTPTQVGALFAMALDGRPLATSRRLVIKMVTRAENTGERLERAPAGAVNGWVLRASGSAPVITYGRASGKPTRIWFAAQQSHQSKRRVSAPPLLTLWMVDGTWELHIDNGQVTLACDTPGMRGLVQGRAFTTGDAAQVSAVTDARNGTAR